MISHLNHFVPQWYQRRFLPDEHNAFIYLDLRPETIHTSGGNRVKSKDQYLWGPGKCFRQKDLYTTTVYGKPNDEIERYLFGDIDARGAKAVSAFLTHDWTKYHEHFQLLFEYMDAQILRTPKGLDWLQTLTGALAQGGLMAAMQKIRLLHCTMWAECVMEVVFADESETKFLLTDHPVTLYNKECFPLSKYCRYPNEPFTELVGTQTIFPLDLNHCFILTNLEYANAPKAKLELLLKSRINARYHKQTVLRTDAVIRKRHLIDREVTTINYILKQRARRYIAAINENWLYPERVIRTPMWSKLAPVLLPPKNELYRFGGEIYIGGENGKLLWYQDGFGHTIKDQAEAQYRQEHADAIKQHLDQLLKKTRR